jgi:hypothetical protein
VPGKKGQAYYLKYKVYGKQFVTNSPDFNTLTFNNPDVYIGEANTYSLDLDRVDLVAYCKPTSAKYTQYKGQFDTKYTGVYIFSDATTVTVSRLGATIPALGSTLYMAPLKSTLPWGAYTVSARSAATVMPSVVNASIPNVGEPHDTYYTAYVAVAGSVPSVYRVGAYVHFNGGRGWIDRDVRIVDVGVNYVTVDLVDRIHYVNATGYPIFYVMSYYAFSHGLAYTPTFASTALNVYDYTDNFVKDSQQNLVYAPFFASKIGFGETRQQDGNDFSFTCIQSRSVLLPSVSSETWDRLGKLDTARWNCDSFVTPASKTYNYKASFRKDDLSITTNTQGVLVPHETLQFSFLMEDDWVCMDKPLKRVTYPADILMDKTYYFTIRPYFLS